MLAGTAVAEGIVKKDAEPNERALDENKPQCVGSQSEKQLFYNRC